MIIFMLFFRCRILFFCAIFSSLYAKNLSFPSSFLQYVLPFFSFFPSFLIPYFHVLVPFFNQLSFSLFQQVLYFSLMRYSLFSSIRSFIFLQYMLPFVQYFLPGTFFRASLHDVSHCLGGFLLLFKSSRPSYFLQNALSCLLFFGTFLVSLFLPFSYMLT